MARTIRVYKDGQVWVAKKDGTNRASAVKNTQREAYLAARAIALNQGLTITVYYPTGGIKAVINPRNKGEEGDCFITTSCVKYFGLPDNCYELQILRKFRDNYLLKSKKGQELVFQYYLLAPAIVTRMEHARQKKLLFKEVFLQIRQACNAIEKKEFSKATRIYKDAVLYLVNYLKVK
jgi:hypothetical protein